MSFLVHSEIIQCLQECVYWIVCEPLVGNKPFNILFLTVSLKDFKQSHTPSIKNPHFITNTQGEGL